MTIDITAEQAKTILVALRARMIAVLNMNAPAQRKKRLYSELDELCDMVAANMIRSGFMTQEEYAKGMY